MTTQDQITQVIAKLREKNYVRQLRIDASGEHGRMPAGAMYELADQLEALLSLHAPGDQEQETPQEKIIVSGAEANQSEASIDEK